MSFIRCIVRIRYSKIRMPCRNFCITTICLQLFSLVTFLSVWQQTERVTVTKNEEIIVERFNVINKSLEYDSSKLEQMQKYTRDPLAEVCIPTHDLNIVCPSLFMGNIKEKIKRNIIVPNMCKLDKLLNDCARFTTAHEYFSRPVLNEEKEFPIAFGIKMHKSPDQAEKLLRAIYRPHNIYCIYVDGKAQTSVFDTMKRISKCFDNIIIIEDRENIVYASSGLIRGDLACMKKCKESKVKWKYYINLTGQEFPLRTNLELVYILKALNGANDVESYTHPVFLQWRFKKKYKTGIISMMETTENKTSFKYDVQISKGSAYGAFTREFVDFVMIDDVAKDFITWLNDTYSPEENVWATLNTLPWAPGGYEMEIRHWYGTFLSRAMIWQDDKTNCRGRFIRGVCIFGVKDLPWLVSRPQLFANKFDDSYDQLSLDCIENFIRNRTLNPTVSTLDWYYYRNLPHVVYHTKLDKKETTQTARNVTKQKWLLQQKQKTVTKKPRTEKPVGVHIAGGSISMFNQMISDDKGWISKPYP